MRPPEDVISLDGEEFPVAVKPELATGLRPPWCVRVGDGWYEVDEFHSIDPAVPDEAARFVRLVRGLGVERGPAWVATSETPLLLRVDETVVKCHAGVRTLRPGSFWTFSANGHSSEGGEADPSDTLDDVVVMVRRWLATGGGHRGLNRLEGV